MGSFVGDAGAGVGDAGGGVVGGRAVGIGTLSRRGVVLIGKGTRVTQEITWLRVFRHYGLAGVKRVDIRVVVFAHGVLQGRMALSLVYRGRHKAMGCDCKQKGLMPGASDLNNGVLVVAGCV